MTEYPSPLSVIVPVWHVVWHEVNGNAAVPITRKNVQRDVGNIPEVSVLGCLIIFESEKLTCCKNAKGETFIPNKNADYDNFQLTGTGANKGDQYYPPPEKK